MGGTVSVGNGEGSSYSGMGGAADGAGAAGVGFDDAAPFQLSMTPPGSASPAPAASRPCSPAPTLATTPAHADPALGKLFMSPALSNMSDGWVVATPTAKPAHSFGMTSGSAPTYSDDTIRGSARQSHSQSQSQSHNRDVASMIAGAFAPSGNPSSAAVSTLDGIYADIALKVRRTPFLTSYHHCCLTNTLKIVCGFSPLHYDYDNVSDNYIIYC
jgi:hypothetical protein